MTNKTKYIIGISVAIASAVILYFTLSSHPKTATLDKSKLKELLAKNPLITFNKKELYFKYQNDKSEDIIDTVKINPNKDYSDIIYIDPAGYLYVTNDLRINENIFTSKCKTGLADLQGNTILKPIYDRVNVFDQTISGNVIIEKNNRLGLADKTGNIVVPIEYSKIYPDFTGSGNIAILVKKAMFYYLSKDNKIALINDTEKSFQDKWNSFTLISNETKDKLLGYPLFEVQNDNIKWFNDKHYTLDYLVDYEPNYRGISKIIFESDLIVDRNAGYSESPLWVPKIKINDISKLFNKVYLFFIDVYLQGDRGSSSNKKIVVCDNLFNKIDSKILFNNNDEEQIDEKSKKEFSDNPDFLDYKFEILNNNLFRVCNYNLGKTIKQIVSINDTGSVELNNNFIEDSISNERGNQHLLFSYSEVKKNENYIYADSNIKIKSLNVNNLHRKEFYFTKYRQIKENDLKIPDYFKVDEESEIMPKIHYRPMTQQEIESILNGIINDYKDSNGKIPVNVENTMTEIDKYNVKFLREKLQKLAANQK